MIDDFETDEELAARLGRALARVDAVPSDVIAAARASRIWRTVDSELAALMYDSVFDRGDRVGVRGFGSRMLTFSSPQLTVELEVVDAGTTVIGQVSAGTGARVEICHADGSAPVEVDHVGHFSYRRVRQGAMSVRVTDPDGTVTQTEWVVI